MEVEEGVKELLSRTKIQLDTEEYIIVSLRLEQEKKARESLNSLASFSSITYDYKEVSIVAKNTEWNKVKKNFTDYEKTGPYKLITFNIVLDLSIVGFMATVSKKLADAGISIYAISTYLRDHILVQSEDAENAVRVLENLKIGS